MALHLRLLLIFLAISFNSFGQFNATIKVTDSDTGLNIENAEVIFDGNFFANTDANGEATFTDVANGTYNYSVSLGCYDLVSGNLTIDNANQVENVVLTPTSTNSIFFYVGSPFTISGATITVSDGVGFYQELITGAPFGDIMENVPFGEYSYTITTPCYETITGSITVNCTNGDGILVEANPEPSTTNSIFFFVGSPLNINGATVTVTDGGDFYQELTTGAPFGDIMENVPFGDYTYTITAPCYETITGSVTVDCNDGNGMMVEANPAEIVIDNTVTQASNILTANASDYDYQWIDCETEAPIEGATDQTFTATQNGTYAVIISSENCSATSECVAVTTVGISENTNHLKVITYPNPFTEIVKFESDAFKSKKVSVKIFTITGQLINNQDFSGQRLIELDLSALQNGAYLVQIITAEGQYFSQIIKQ